MKILLASGHASIREGMRQVLNMLDEKLELLEVDDCPSALDLAGMHLDLDLILLDFSMPGAYRPAVLNQLRQFCPARPIVVLSVATLPDHGVCLFEHSEMGIAPKVDSTRALVGALRLLLSGNPYISPILLRENSEVGMFLTTTDQDDDWTDSCKSATQIKLTPRQREVLSRMAQGKSNKVIARELGVAIGTVKAHVTAVLKTLNAANRTQAVIGGRGGANVVRLAPSATHGGKMVSLQH